MTSDFFKIACFRDPNKPHVSLVLNENENEILSNIIPQDKTLSISCFEERSREAALPLTGDCPSPFSLACFAAAHCFLLFAFLMRTDTERNTAVIKEEWAKM